MFLALRRDDALYQSSIAFDHTDFPLLDPSLLALLIKFIPTCNVLADPCVLVTVSFVEGPGAWIVDGDTETDERVSTRLSEVVNSSQHL